MKIDESMENTVILLSQFSCISFGVSNHFAIMIALKASMLIDCNFQYLIVCGMVRLWLNGICKSATTEKWSDIYIHFIRHSSTRVQTTHLRHKWLLDAWVQDITADQAETNKQTDIHSFATG